MSYSYRFLGNFGAGGASKWYFGQHAKVCAAMQNGDLKQAITDATALVDLGIQGKTYEAVIASPELLTTFKDAFNGFRGKMPSYSDGVVDKGNSLLEAAITKARPVHQEGKWQCQGAPPPSDATSYYHCCPSGWTKTIYEDSNPCKGLDRGLVDCGPLPPGVTADQAVCCAALKEWYPASTDGSDPCHQAAMSSGRAVPGVTETMLAPDIEMIKSGSDSNLFMIFGLGAVLLILVTVLFKQIL